MRFDPIRKAGRILRRAGNELLKHASLKGIWIDVGAHHGEVTFDAAINNPDLMIYAFEPNLRAASRLFGRAPNYIVIPMAVAENDGCSQFHLNSFDQASSLLKMDETARRAWKGGDVLREESITTVPTIRLDTFLDLMRISHIDFLKVDTQGQDLAVVRSAGQRIGDIHKITLEVDVTSNRLYQGSPSKQDVLSFLGAAGFRLVATQQQGFGQEENLTFECSPLP